MIGIGLGILIFKWRSTAGRGGKALSQTEAARLFRKYDINWTAARLSQVELGDMRKASDKQIDATAQVTGYSRPVCYFFANAIPPELRPASGDHETVTKIQAALAILYEFFGCGEAGPARPSGMEERYGFMFEPTNPLDVEKRKVPDYVREYEPELEKIFG